MAQVDTNCSLDYDEMSAFLSKIDDGWVLDLSPLEPPVPVATISPRNKVIRSKKPRRYTRLDILDTRRELADLELQLQILKEKHEFYESLRAEKSSCGLSWRLFASCEQILMKKSARMNAQLHKRMSDNNRLIHRIHRLIQRNPMESMPKSVQVSCRIVSLDNEMNVRRVLQACLDDRSKHQVDSIVEQCNGGFDATSHDQQLNEWNSVAFGDRGVGVEFRESVVLPFNASFISSAMGDWPSIDPFGINRHKRSERRQDVHYVPKQEIRGETTGLNRRLILQRLVQVRGRTIVLWEDAFCCENNTNSSSVTAMVRGSGWALMSPAEGQTTDISVVHSGGFLQIRTVDQSNLQPSDQLSTDIVSYTQALHRSRMTSLEHILMDSFREQYVKLESIVPSQ